MLVKDIMNPDVKTIRKDATIKEAAELMSQFSIGSLIVVEDSTRVIGIITERDILMKIVAKAKDASTELVEDSMTKEVIMVDAETDIDDAAEIMLEKKIKKLPVISKNSLIGIVTSMDLCTASPKMIERLGKVLLLPKEKKVVAG
jgi:CBS domain-containing protein